jgi:putative membrane protein insertion efficiency factor
MEETGIVAAADRAARRALIAGVKGYQRYLGWALGGHCRFCPSCSWYALEALQTKPVHRAVGLTVWRILRCQPLCSGGEDPVPHRPGDERWRIDLAAPHKP